MSPLSSNLGTSRADLGLSGLLVRHPDYPGPASIAQKWTVAILKVCNIARFQAGTVAMTINRLVARTSLGPEEIRLLNEAYERALRALHLVDRNDPLTEMVAKKIIEVSKAGINDPAQVSQLAIKDLRFS